MEFGQVFTAMVTPMKADGSVDWQQAVHLAKRMGESGSDGVVLAGTTGESPTLTFEEKIKLFDEVVNAVGGSVEIIAGTGSNNTAETLRLTQEAERAGVDGIMLVTPYYNKPSQEGLYEHFKTVAEAASLPIMLYNVPGRTGANLLPQTVTRLAKITNIRAIKEASGDLDQVGTLKRMVPENFLIYSGEDSMTLPMLSLGGAGVVSVASHLVGRRIKEMIESFLAGKHREAASIHRELIPLFDVLFLTTNPVMVKRALNLMNLHTGPFRLPLVEPTAEEAQELKDVLASYGLLERP